MRMPSDPTQLLDDRELLARLIAFDSVSDRPIAPIADFIADYAERAGCRVWRQVYANGAKINLILRRGPERAGGLTLSGHLDVVPAAEPDWTGDPFVLREVGGRLIGRGVADMKGFVALALNALCECEDDALRHPLALLLTCDEEVGCLGAQHFAANWRGEFPLPPDVLVGEPTRLRPVRMHKGHLKLRITLTGKPAHSGYPHLGANAIERAAPVLGVLSALATEWRQVRTENSAYFPECPYPVLNIGLIRGGSAVNIVPERCVIDFGVRLLPGQTSAAALAEVRERLSRLPAETQAALALAVVNDSPPMYCPSDAALNVALCELRGDSATHGVSFASDAGPLSAAGMRCVLCGPGEIENAHRADESIGASELAEAQVLLTGLIRRLCQT